MGLTLITTAALALWLVLWSIGVKAIDAFILLTVIVLLGAMGRIASRFIPGSAQKPGL